jgi:peptidoglycan/xylan/chitin deacetylase (PgdA/CDA1 family)
VEVRRSKGINQPLILLSGLIILVGAVFTYYYILNGVFGRIDDSDLIPDAKAVNHYLFGEKPKAAILYSNYTQNILPDKSSWLRDNIGTWQKFFDLMNVKYDIIYDHDIENGDLIKYDLLILPGSRSLSDREILYIKKYLDEGGSVFATSGTASYSADGKWRGWQFLSEVFGINYTREISDSSGSKVHTLRGGLPITADIPTGYPLRVATFDVPMAAEVLDPRTQQVSFWYNYRLEKGLVREELTKSAGIVYGTYGPGRFVWMGFEINSVVGIKDDYVYFERMFHNCVNWLGKKPVAYIKEWPGSYNAAAVIMPVLSKDLNNTGSLMEILSSEKVQATFLVDAVTASQNSSLLRNLSYYGNVSAIVDVGYLTSIHDSINTLNNYASQLRSLEKSKKTIENITGTPVAGIKPYFGLYDRNTIRALLKAGYTYIITDSLNDRSVPRNLIFPEGNVVSMIRSSRDDYEIIRDFNITEPSLQFYTYQEDIDRVLFEGSLFMFQPHTDYQLKPEYVHVAREVISDLKDKNFWITTPEEIANWYSKKNYIELKVDQRGPKRLSLRITNPGVELMEEVIINVQMNLPVEDLSISTEIIGVKPAGYKYDPEKNIIYLFVKDLEQGESRTYYLDYSPVSI